MPFIADLESWATQCVDSKA